MNAVLEAGQSRVKRRRVAENPIEIVNNKEDAAFVAEHLRPRCVNKDTMLS